jgi:hypothetical protein
MLDHKLTSGFECLTLVVIKIVKVPVKMATGSTKYDPTELITEQRSTLSMT